ncbi:hypothetical protein ACLUXI_06220 [Bifidobacterium apri]|uniref:hypothetical protein n=1 Tax=Bifidobacterium apri TaxID=1769423 RepID=UPI00399294E1
MNNSQQDIPVIDIPAQTHPWSTVLALAEATDDPTDWRLTGGLMAQLHAMPAAPKRGRRPMQTFSLTC